MTTPALRLRGIVKSFGAVRAVDSIDLDIEEGEFLTLLGSSGSGKSTLLAIIAGFETADSGSVELGGIDIAGRPPHRRGIGMVFQSYALFPHLTVYDNVAFGLRSLRWSEGDIARRLAELLDLAHLKDYVARRPAELSGGQQQRVALIRALAARPRLLLLDEPLGALDKNLREHMMAEFRSIHRALGTTMVYVTHDQQEALVMSDRVAVMHGGRLVRVGTPADLYDDPRTVFVAGFIGESNLIEARRGPSGTLEAPGPIHIPAPADIADGPVHLTIRPERLVLGATPEGWAGGTATVTERVFLGDRLKYRLACGPSVLTAQHARGQAIHEEGAELRFGWHPDDTRFLFP